MMNRLAQFEITSVWLSCILPLYLCGIRELFYQKEMTFRFAQVDFHSTWIPSSVLLQYR